MKTYIVFNYGTCDQAHIEFDETLCETEWENMDNKEREDYGDFNDYRNEEIYISIITAICKHHGREVAREGYENMEEVTEKEYNDYYIDSMRF